VEIATLVLEFLKALVWPAVALTALILFRHRLHALFERLTSLEAPGGMKASFAERLAEVHDSLEDAQVELESAHVGVEPVEPQAHSDESTHSPGAVSEKLAVVGGLESDALTELRLIRLGVEEDPDRAVIDAWRALDRFMSTLSIPRPKDKPEWKRGSGLPGLLFLRDEAPLMDAIKGLRQLRNQVAHGGAHVSDLRTAQRYVNTVEEVVESAATLTRRRLVGSSS
jgi:hypothetical protein